MGNNVACVIMTDFIGDLAENPDAFKAIRDAINAPIDHACMPLKGFAMLPYHHASSTRIVAVGNNTIVPLAWSHARPILGATDESLRIAIRRLQDELERRQHEQRMRMALFAKANETPP